MKKFTVDVTLGTFYRIALDVEAEDESGALVAARVQVRMFSKLAFFRHKCTMFTVTA
jgi:hypothetical protein